MSGSRTNRTNRVRAGVRIRSACFNWYLSAYRTSRTLPDIRTFRSGTSQTDIHSPPIRGNVCPVSGPASCPVPLSGAHKRARNGSTRLRCRRPAMGQGRGNSFQPYGIYKPPRPVARPMPSMLPKGPKTRSGFLAFRGPPQVRCMMVQ
jgi:hypothetical protein